MVSKKLEADPDFSPIKKKKKTFGNYIDIFETKVPHFLVAIVTRADKNESPYMKPFVTAFEEDETGDLSVDWNIIKIATHKGEKYTNGTYNPMPKSPGSNIAWDAYVAYKTGSVATPKALGIHIGKKFNKFVANCNEVRCFERFVSF